MPIVSIVVPVYKVEAYLVRSIESILAQTFKDFEVILVDDGSPDNSGLICDEFAKRDQRVVVFHNQNEGASAARKYGVMHARGEWVMFVDSDDSITPECLQLLWEHHFKGDIICGTLNLNNKVIFQHKVDGTLSSKSYIEALLYGNTSIGPVAKLIRKELFAFEEWNEDKRFKNNEDLMMLILLASKAKNIYIQPDAICYNYLFREGSQTSNVSPIQVWLDLFEEIKKMLLDIYDILPKAFVSYELRLLYVCVILKGNTVDIKDPRIVSIIDSCRCFDLSKSDKEYLDIIKSKNRQRFVYMKHHFISSLKSNIKKLLNVKR